MSESVTAALHGGLLAFGLILPIGPQNMFVFTNGISNSLLRALIVASGAAVSDTLLITIGVLGVSGAAFKIPLVKNLMILSGVMFMVYFGYVSWNKQPRVEHSDSKFGSSDPNSNTLRFQVVVAFLAGVLNPHAILDTIVVIGSSSLNYSDNSLISYALACIGVSWLWFFTLVLLGRSIGKLPRVAQASSKISALAMWGCASFLLLTWLK
jgi:L-lysine exporter family protein LysE/ArgO